MTVPCTEIPTYGAVGTQISKSVKDGTAEYQLSIWRRAQACGKLDDATSNIFVIEAHDNAPPHIAAFNPAVLNHALKFAGSPTRVPDTIAQEQYACFSENLARIVVELAQNIPADGAPVAFGNDSANAPLAFHANNVTSLDTLAAVINHGLARRDVAVCKAPQR
ncbi:MAG: hypothetical protein V4735_05570 [Pseudomonadota bacterium]